MANLIRRTVSSKCSLPVLDRLCANHVYQAGRQLRSASTLRLGAPSGYKQLTTVGDWTRPSLGSKIAQQREFSQTAIRGRDHQFDTLKFVQKLKDEGFTEDQAVAMMKVLNDVIEERCVKLESEICNARLTSTASLI